jgi:acylphosphatase
MRKQAKIIYKGTVQGVGFRWTAQEIAMASGVVGWVKNLANGTVEILCEGEENDLEIFMNKIKTAMGHYITSSNVEWSQYTGKFDSFSIQFDYS